MDCNLQKLTEALNSMPSTYEEIIDLFEKEGIKGKFADCGECVVARYLTKKVGRPCRVGLSSHNRYSVWVNGFDRETYMILPEHVSEVARAFDDNMLPSFRE